MQVSEHAPFLLGWVIIRTIHASMQSRVVTFCLGAVVGLGGAAGLYRVRLQLLESRDSSEDQELQDDRHIFRYIISYS